MEPREARTYLDAMYEILAERLELTDAPAGR